MMAVLIATRKKRSNGKGREVLLVKREAMGMTEKSCS